MARRFNSSQFRSRIRQVQSQIRQAQQKQRRAIVVYKQKVQTLNRAIDNYNREVRSYNARRRQNRARLESELARLQRQLSAKHSGFRTSVAGLQQTYARMEQSVGSRSLAPEENFFLDLSEREAANSVAVANALLDPASVIVDPGLSLQETIIEDELAVISEELDSRWRGALFALNPSNPEASRHFCSSSREIIAAILEAKAPDELVFRVLPACSTTDLGNPTRRSKIQYLLEMKGLTDAVYVDFASEDVDNILELFGILNAGTHGTSGRYDLATLLAIKRRVEDGLQFLARIAA